MWQSSTRFTRRRGAAALAAAALGLALGSALSGCGHTAGGAALDSAAAKPATAVPIPGSDLKTVVLTADAAQRIGLQTAPVSRVPAPHGGAEDVIPVSAVYYDGNGGTWVYTNPGPLHYVRASVRLGPITGDTAVLAAGPAASTPVVTVGEAELYGVEYGVGGEQ